MQPKISQLQLKRKLLHTGAARGVHHHFIAALPFTDVHLPFSAKEMGGESSSQDDDEGSMDHHEGPFFFTDVMISIEQQEKVNHQHQLEKQEQGGIVDQHFRCYRSHVLLHQRGCGQSPCKDQQQENRCLVGGQCADYFLHAAAWIKPLPTACAAAPAQQVRPPYGRPDTRIQSLHTCRIPAS